MEGSQVVKSGCEVGTVVWKQARSNMFMYPTPRLYIVIMEAFAGCGARAQIHMLHYMYAGGIASSDQFCGARRDSRLPATWCCGL